MRVPVVCAALLLAGMMGLAQNWPQWRGTGGDGIAAPGEYPVAFSATNGVLWRVPLPGKGASTPAVWDERIFLTSAVGEGSNGLDGALCLDWKTGRQLWQVTFGTQRPGKHKRGTGSNPSPVTDGQRVFVYFKSGTLAALDMDGKILWQTNLQERYAKDALWWDLGTSPVLVDGRLVVAVMQESDSYMVALNPATGEEIWKVDRNYSCKEEGAQSYSTPLVVRREGRTELVLWGAEHLTGHDAATGALLWQCGGFNPDNKPYWRTISSPAIADGIAVVPYGRDQFVAGVKLGGSGDITAAARVWEKRNLGTDSASPVIFGGKVCLMNFKGKTWCLDLQTGDELWVSSLDGKGMVYSSPVLAGDTLYVCREEGDVYVSRITDAGLEPLNRAKFDDAFIASPVLLRGRLLLRGEKNLWCIGTN